MTDEQKLQLINELIEWNKWQVHSIDLNEVPTKEYTHSEGMAYTKGQYDYGVQIHRKLELVKEQLVKK
jgi:hypothetical protein